jgi:hypothetical protein
VWSAPTSPPFWRLGSRSYRNSPGRGGARRALCKIRCHGRSVAILPTVRVSYIKTVRPAGAENRHLFLAGRQVPISGDRALDFEGIKMILKRVIMETEVRVHAVGRDFRHRFTTRAPAACVDSLVLQRAIGHSTPAMVKRHVHFQAQALLEPGERGRIDGGDELRGEALRYPGALTVTPRILHPPFEVCAGAVLRRREAVP